MFALKALVLTLSLLKACEGAFVDTLQMCSVKDSECLKGLYQNMMKSVGNTGVAELGIPPLDPMDLQNISLNLMDAATLTIKQGTLKGMGSCVFNEFSAEIEKHKAHIDVTCDLLTVKGHFDITGESPAIQSFIGTNNVNGNGKAKIKVEKINLNFDIKFYPFKKDGDVYLKLSNKGSSYKYNIANAHVVTENVIVANNDISQVVNNYFNENWREIMKSFGATFLDKAMGLFVNLVQKFCDAIPANKYIKDDLMPYL